MSNHFVWKKNSRIFPLLSRFSVYNQSKFNLIMFNDARLITASLQFRTHWTTATTTYLWSVLWRIVSHCISFDTYCRNRAVDASIIVSHIKREQQFARTSVYNHFHIHTNIKYDTVHSAKQLPHSDWKHSTSNLILIDSKGIKRFSTNCKKKWVGVHKLYSVQKICYNTKKSTF